MIYVKEYQRGFEWVSITSSRYKEKCVRCGTVIETEERFGPSGLLGVKTTVIGKEPVTNEEKAMKTRDDAKEIVTRTIYFSAIVIWVLYWIFYIK